MELQASFRVSELVVHPVYGLCRITGIERAHVRGCRENCYVFRMGSVRNPVKVLIPIAQAEASGLRRPISKQEAEQVLRVLHMPATPLEPRSREELGEVSARLASNDSLQIAKTIRDLAAAGVKKWLSRSDVTLVDTRHGEQATLISALERLTEELAYAQHASRKDVEEYVRKCLGRARKRPKAHVIQN